MVQRVWFCTYVFAGHPLQVRVKQVKQGMAQRKIITPGVYLYISVCKFAMIYYSGPSLVMYPKISTTLHYGKIGEPGHEP